MILELLMVIVAIGFCIPLVWCETSDHSLESSEYAEPAEKPESTAPSKRGEEPHYLRL